MVGLDDFTVQLPERHPDPGEIVSRNSGIGLLNRNDDNESEWKDVVDLLVRALLTGGEARKRATIRLASMGGKEHLTETETSEVADALWTVEYVPVDSLPTGTSLFDFEFLDLPEPKLGLASRQVRRRWLACDSVVSRHDGLRPGVHISVDFGLSPGNQS